ncbi:hypothetical protein MHOCP_07690 [Moorella humiferrea]|uniref:hypothetical protein n=1 Tax=Neomoorella humiferrea TaxID=676965 RepID=UPI0030D3D9AF
MDKEKEKAAKELLRAYLHEIELVQAWRRSLQQQRQYIQTGAWEALNNFLEESLSMRVLLSEARQTTRQLEKNLALVAEKEVSSWEKIELLTPETRWELASASRHLRTLWEECRELQEANLKIMQEVMVKIKLELEQVQTARQMARAYRREYRTAAPRCLDRRL